MKTPKIQLILLKNYKNVIAASLLESVISLAILSTCLGLAILIVVNTTSYQSSYFVRIKINEALDKQIEEDLSQSEGVFIYDGVTITKTVNSLGRMNYIEIVYTATLGIQSNERKVVVQKTN